MKNRIKVIIFDFDGVIAESVNIKTEAFAKLYESYGEEVVRRVVKHHLAHGGVSRFEKFKLYHKEFLGINLNDEEIQLLATQFSDLVIQKVVEAPYVPGALDFIKYNYRKYDLFVSTATPEDEMKDILKRKRINNYFKEIYGSPHKKGEHVQIILNTYGYSNYQVVLIGDSMSDKEAADLHNIHFIGRINEPGSLGRIKYKIIDLYSLKAVINRLK